MFVNLQLVVFMQYARFLLSHKADAISGRSRPWAKLGGGGGGGEGGFLPLTLPPFLPSAILSFFFFTQNKGVGGGGTDPRVPTFDPLLHILRTPYTWGNECWKFESCFTFMDFSARSKEHTFWKLARLSQPKKKSVQSSSSSFEDTGGVLFDR